jgi:hypothetical protein
VESGAQRAAFQRGAYTASSLRIRRGLPYRRRPVHRWKTCPVVTCPSQAQASGRIERYLRRRHRTTSTSTPVCGRTAGVHGIPVLPAEAGMISLYECARPDRLAAFAAVAGTAGRAIPPNGPQGPVPDPATCNSSRPMPCDRPSLEKLRIPGQPYLGGGASLLAVRRCAQTAHHRPVGRDQPTASRTPRDGCHRQRARTNARSPRATRPVGGKASSSLQPVAAAWPLPSGRACGGLLPLEPVSRSSPVTFRDRRTEISGDSSGTTSCSTSATANTAAD